MPKRNIAGETPVAIGPRVLLDEADATTNPGYRVRLDGRDGCGKTTLLRLVAGELEPDAGRIEARPVFGRATTGSA